MKNILFILTIFLSFNCFSQDKIVKIPQSELNTFFLAIDTLEYQDSIKTLYIADLELQNKNFKELIINNTAIVENKDKEILLLNEEIKLYSDRLKKTNIWYNKRWFGVIIGIVGTSTSIYLAGQINN
jgi:hypothetical protein